MNEQQFRTLWAGYNDALMARDVECVFAFYTDDIIYDESPMMMKVPRRGKRECAKVLVARVRCVLQNRDHDVEPCLRR